MSSTDRKAIAAPAKGLLVFDNDKAAFMYWDGVRWQMLVPGNSSLSIKREVMAPAAENTRGFGTEVTMKGAYAAIASNKDGDYKGVVYIYEKNAAGAWEQKQMLTAPTPKSSDDFGFSLDMDGDYLVVGDPVRQNSSGKEAGLYMCTAASMVLGHMKRQLNEQQHLLAKSLGGMWPFAALRRRALL
jgi:hypothetical protein